MLRNLASSLILTERDAEFEDNAPKVKGRVVTTLHKAKEVRPLVEKCVTIARRSLQHEERAREFESNADRNSNDWKEWRESERWQQWVAARAPAVAARRRALQLLGDREAVQILFDDIAPRFADRDGGYTRILRLAKPRVGDAGTQAILEFVGVHDREIERSERPAFADEEEPAESPVAESEEPAAEEETAETEASQAESGGEPSAEGEDQAKS